MSEQAHTPYTDQIAATERMTKGFLFSYRANAILLNASTAVVLPFLNWSALAQNAGPVTFPLLVHAYTVAMTPVNSVINFAVTAAARRNRHELVESQNQLGLFPAQPLPQATRNGTKLQTDYIVDKIQNTLPQDKWARAIQLSAVTHALRQNVLVQALSYKALGWATMADVFGYALQEINMGAFGGKRAWKNKFIWRNTCKALLTDLGLIAPSEDNMKDILENSLIKRSNGRIGYEAWRLAQHAPHRG